jgi:hypothetical protein
MELTALRAGRQALAIDISPWDDPDYEFLAFIGRPSVHAPGMRA